MRVIPQIPYYPGGPTFDAYLPLDGAAAHPALVMVHGGGWQEGDKATYAPYAVKAATEQHWAAFAVNYRLDANDKAAWADELHDVQAAIRYLVTQRVDLWHRSRPGGPARGLGRGQPGGADLRGGDHQPREGDRRGRRRPRSTSPSGRPRCGRPRSTWPIWWARPAGPRRSAGLTRPATSSGARPTSSTTSAACLPPAPRPTSRRRPSAGCRRRRRPRSWPTRPTSSSPSARSRPTWTPCVTPASRWSSTRCRAPATRRPTATTCGCRRPPSSLPAWAPDPRRRPRPGLSAAARGRRRAVAIGVAVVAVLVVAVVVASMTRRSRRRRGPSGEAAS